MHAVVQALGAITVAIGVLIIGVSIFTSNGDAGRIIAGVTIGGPAVLAGALLYTFGSIVEHLIAIRRSAERQVEIFDKLGKPKT